MPDFFQQELLGSLFERVDLSGAQFRTVDLSGARFRGVYMSGVVMRGVELVDSEINGEIPVEGSGWPESRSYPRTRMPARHPQ